MLNLVRVVKDILMKHQHIRTANAEHTVKWDDIRIMTREINVTENTN